MSLINDMLRDLETRRAAPTERLQLSGLHAVDETAAARRTSRLWVFGLALLLLIGLALWLVLTRPSLSSVPPVLPNPTLPVPTLPVSALPVPALPVPALPVSGLPVPALAMPRVESAPVPSAVAPPGGSATAIEPAVLASKAADHANESAPATPALDKAPAAVQARIPEKPAGDKKAQAPTGAPGNATDLSQPQISIAPLVPDGLTRARQALQAGDYPRAIRVLKALEQRRNTNSEVTRWLARAYLAGGESEQLLAWLPARLAQWPQDTELRVLLARGQLLAGQPANAVNTLQGSPPSLHQEPTYHALLAAIYQQTGEWQQSAALYRQLIELQPTQSSWQLGLAIALEQLAQPVAAARHYRLVQQGPNLNEAAWRFAGERAAALGARL